MYAYFKQKDFFLPRLQFEINTMHPHLLHLLNVICSLHLESNWQEMLSNRKRWFGDCSGGSF